MVLLVRSLDPSVCGWYDDDIFNLIPVSLCKDFQKLPIVEEETFRTRKFTVTAQAYISLSQKGTGACCAGGTRDPGPPSTVEDERVAGNVGYWGTSTGNDNGRLLTDARRAGKERRGMGGGEVRDVAVTSSHSGP